MKTQWLLRAAGNGYSIIYIGQLPLRLPYHISSYICDGIAMQQPS